jgi:uncharacterized phage protein (TIGR01671 family)
MRREVKFRAWDGKKMKLAFDLSQNPKYWWKKNKDYPLMQYTGLKDNNGKEIYEGDVFKDNTDFNFWEVFYVSGGNYVSNGFETLPIGDFIIKSNICFCEIIGNIYENPEMLNEVKQ